MLSEMFRRCLNIPYTSVENSGDFALERIGDRLFVYLECSDGEEDWQNNLDFIRAWRAIGRLTEALSEYGRP